MRMLYSGIMILSITQCVCFGMDVRKYILVKTPDKKTSLFQKSNINQSLVLNVLHAHQKEKDSNIIIIPKACKKADDVVAEDVRALRNLLYYEGKAFVSHMKKLDDKERMHCIHATHVLQASRQLVNVINCLFSFPKEVKTYIGSKIVSCDYRKHVIKQIIRKKEVIHKIPISVRDCKLSSDASGACFYYPSEIVSFQPGILFSGVTPFVARHSCKEQDSNLLGAMSCKGNYYVTGTGRFDDEGLFLCNLKENELLSEKKLLMPEDEITQVVFDAHEKFLIIGSSGEAHNLICWDLERFATNADEGAYSLLGHDGAVGKVIVSDGGKYVVSSEKEIPNVFVWDVVGKIGSRLSDDYEHPVTAMTFSKKDKQLWICSGATISLWQESEQEELIFDLVESIELNNSEAVICKMLVNEQTGYIVVGTTDGKLNVICMHTMEEIFCLEGHKNAPINVLIGNKDWNIIVSATNEFTDNVIIWDICTGKCLANLLGHSCIKAVLLTPDMRYIVSQSRKQICLWHMYGELEDKALAYMHKSLDFLHFYELYYLYKRIKNGYSNDNLQTSWIESLPVVAGVKEFVKKYLL